MFYSILSLFITFIPISISLIYHLMLMILHYDLHLILLYYPSNYHHISIITIHQIYNYKAWKEYSLFILFSLINKMDKHFHPFRNLSKIGLFVLSLIQNHYLQYLRTMDNNLYLNFHHQIVEAYEVPLIIYNSSLLIYISDLTHSLLILIYEDEYTIYPLNPKL